MNKKQFSVIVLLLLGLINIVYRGINKIVFTIAIYALDGRNPIVNLSDFSIAMEKSLSNILIYSFIGTLVFIVYLYVKDYKKV